MLKFWSSSSPTKANGAPQATEGGPDPTTQSDPTTTAATPAPPMNRKESVAAIGDDVFMTPTAELPGVPLDTDGQPPASTTEATPAALEEPPQVGRARRRSFTGRAFGFWGGAKADKSAERPAPAPAPAEVPTPVVTEEPAPDVPNGSPPAAAPAESSPPRKTKGFWASREAKRTKQAAAIAAVPAAAEVAPVVLPDAQATDNEEAQAPVAPAGKPRKRKSIKKKHPQAKAAETPVEPSPAPQQDVPAVPAVPPMVAPTPAPVDEAPTPAPADIPAAAAPVSSPPAVKKKNVVVKKSEKKAEKAALGLRSLILGTPGSPDGSTPKGQMLTKSDVNKLKGILLEPKSANKVIAKLRDLPVPLPPQPEKVGKVPATDGVVSVEAAAARSVLAIPTDGAPHGPIHAVCLDCTDEEAAARHFSRLNTMAYIGTPSIALATAAVALPMLRDMRIISLIGTPDLGLGQPVGGEGVLAGSVPDPATVNGGLQQLTQQMMALGFATSAAVHPTHEGIYPPLDRMSVLTYWWGLEVCLPEPSMKFLAHVKSVQSTVLNVLSALSMFDAGVKEALPFIRYISQFIDFEWSAIQAQDKGSGVVCAATWIMPAAMVPRPWDFASPPAANDVTKDARKSKAKTKAVMTPPDGTTFGFSAPLTSLPQLMVTPPSLPRHSDLAQLHADPNATA